MTIPSAVDGADLQDAFLSAPFVDDGWETALKLLADRTGSSRAHMLGLGGPAALFNLMPDVDDSYQREFLEIEGWRPEVNWRVAVTGRSLQILSEEDYDRAKERHPSDAYEEHIRRWDGLFGCQTSLIRDDDLLIGLAVLRSRKDGRTNRRDRDVFAAGAAHALAAVRMQHAIAHRGAGITADAFHALGVAAFLVGWNGGVAGLSLEAEALLRQDDPPLTLRNGRLAATRSDVDRALRAALGQALARQPHAGPMEQIWLHSPGFPANMALCEIFRLPRREWDFGFDPCLLVVVRPASEIPATRLAPLRAAFGLTRSEAEIALRLANGEDRDRIGADRGTSGETIRSQIKALLRKSDTGREAEFVSLVNRLLG